MATLTARRLPDEERRKQLLLFGRKYFGEQAVNAVSMDEIARQAGVSKALLYHYFGGRRGFYLATIHEVAEEVLAITEPPSDLPFDQAFRAMLLNFVRYIKQNSSIYRALIRGGLGVDPEVNDLLDRIRLCSMERIVQRLGIASPTAVMRIALYGWISFVENACLEWLNHEDVSEHELVELLADALTPVVKKLL
jgi:AcrR family transcriptional regulator